MLQTFVIVCMWLNLDFSKNLSAQSCFLSRNFPNTAVPPIKSNYWLVSFIYYVVCHGTPGGMKCGSLRLIKIMVNPAKL